MPTKLNSSDLTNVMLGDVQVETVTLGEAQVWSSTIEVTAPSGATLLNVADIFNDAESGLWVADKKKRLIVDASRGPLEIDSQPGGGLEIIVNNGVTVAGLGGASNGGDGGDALLITTATGISVKNEGIIGGGGGGGGQGGAGGNGLHDVIEIREPATGDQYSMAAPYTYLDLNPDGTVSHLVWDDVAQQNIKGHTPEGFEQLGWFYKVGTLKATFEDGVKEYACWREKHSNELTSGGTGGNGGAGIGANNQTNTGGIGEVGGENAGSGGSGGKGGSLGLSGESGLSGEDSTPILISVVTEREPLTGENYSITGPDYFFWKKSLNSPRWLEFGWGADTPNFVDPGYKDANGWVYQVGAYHSNPNWKFYGIYREKIEQQPSPTNLGSPGSPGGAAGKAIRGYNRVIYSGSGTLLGGTADN